MMGFVRRASLLSLIASVLLLAALAMRIVPAAAQEGVALPAPAIDLPASQASSEVMVIAGGCFWGVQGVFQHVNGVSNAISGYAGGAKSTAVYELTNSGTTGHAGPCRSRTPAPDHLRAVATDFLFRGSRPDAAQSPGARHRPTVSFHHLRRQRGTRARGESLHRATRSDIAPSRSASSPRLRIGGSFTPAEKYHQDFLVRNPRHPYIVYNDLPTIENLKRLFPARTVRAGVGFGSR